MYEAVAAAVAGHAELEGLQLLVDAIAERVIGHGVVGLELPPLAIPALAPLLFVGHGLSLRSLMRVR